MVRLLPVLFAACLLGLVLAPYFTSAGRSFSSSHRRRSPHHTNSRIHPQKQRGSSSIYHSADDLSFNLHHSSVGDLNWSNLTSSDISSLPLATLSAASPTDFSLIPPLSCSGFDDTQLSVIGTNCTGFTEACFQNMTTTALPGLSTLCASVLTSHITRGLSSSQLTALNMSTWQAFSEDALDGLRDEMCAVLTSEIVSVLGTFSTQKEGVHHPPHSQPDSSYYSSSSSAAPTNNLNACSGLTSSCITHTSDDIFSLLQAPCASYLTTNVWSSISANQLGEMNKTIFRTVSAEQIGAVTTACSGMKPAQAALLPDGGPLSATRLCAALQTSCISAFQPQVFSVLQTNCIADLNSTAFSLLSAAQISQITMNGSYGLSRADIAAMVECQGLQPDQLTVLGLFFPFDTCVGFSQICLSSITPSYFGAFQPSCFAQLPAASFAQLTAAQIGNVSQPSIQLMSAAQLNGLSHQACAGFTENQIPWLGTISPYSTCQGFTSLCLSELSMSAWKSLTSNCFSFIPTKEIASLTLQQLSELSSDVISGITSQQLIEWTQKYDVAFISQIWIQPYETSDLSDQALLGFKAAIGSGVLQPNYTMPGSSVEEISKLTPLQLAFCLESCMQILLASENNQLNLLSLPLKTYRGLRGDQLATIPALSFGLISPNVYGELLSDSLAAILPQQVPTIAPQFMSSINIGQLSLAAVSQLVDLQLANIASSQWINQFTCTQYNIMSGEQKSQIHQYAFDAYVIFQSACSSGVPACTVCDTGSDSGTTYSSTVFWATVVGTFAGTLLLTVMMYFCCLMPKRDGSNGGDDAYHTAAYESDNLEQSYHATSMSSGGSGRRRTTRGGVIAGSNGMAIPAEGGQDNLRSPLAPNAAAAALSSSPLQRGGPLIPNYSQADLQDHLRDDDEDEIGSRF